MSACASSGTYVYNSAAAAVDLVESGSHEFELVKVYADDGELVVYGRVRHAHGECTPDAHVDLVILDGGQKPVAQRSVPLVDRGDRRRGWYGAAFRTRVAGHPQPGETIRLAFHDDGCRPSTHFDCGGNVAANVAAPHE